jgi:hypothetical protein
MNCKNHNNSKTELPILNNENTMNVEKENRNIKAGNYYSDIATWPRMQVDSFGCLIEKQFGYKDSVFNCDLKNYTNIGDPCQNTDAYYEGFQLPDSVIKKIYPDIDELTLSWEHGNLQYINISFLGLLDTNKLKSDLNLPSPQIDLFGPRNNIMRIDAHYHGTNSTSLYIQGFEHMGAGEVDCGDEADSDTTVQEK